VKIFADRLRNLRAEKKLKQKELQQILGLKSRSAISNYEKNDREPDFETLVKISEYFDVSTDFLLGVTDKKDRG
jgi:transcriptional regulator with XRE-family HTH domain